ncbi:hypothetical protein QR680_008743 [Steinernema hermaphroditum]|uniref:Uncharacterized protein n=2 Tax=Steinernema hermaphroditum TaxID=289476 RepID=A0AA39IHT7_9BILA|nr:hypothetical protein QR680_008743 [Steinernema hermaphroditum]
MGVDCSHWSFLFVADMPTIHYRQDSDTFGVFKTFHVNSLFLSGAQLRESIASADLVGHSEIDIFHAHSGQGIADHDSLPPECSVLYHLRRPKVTVPQPVAMPLPQHSNVIHVNPQRIHLNHRLMQTQNTVVTVMPTVDLTRRGGDNKIGTKRRSPRESPTSRSRSRGSRSPPNGPSPSRDRYRNDYNKNEGYDRRRNAYGRYDSRREENGHDGRILDGRRDQYDRRRQDYGSRREDYDARRQNYGNRREGHPYGNRQGNGYSGERRSFPENNANRRQNNYNYRNQQEHRRDRSPLRPLQNQTATLDPALIATAAAVVAASQMQQKQLQTQALLQMLPGSLLRPQQKAPPMNSPRNGSPGRGSQGNSGRNLQGRLSYDRNNRNNFRKY